MFFTLCEHNRATCYSQLRNLISEDDIIKCIQLIIKIKEHRHNKIKARQINKFKHLINKNSGYMYNLPGVTTIVAILTIAAGTFLWVDTHKTHHTDHKTANLANLAVPMPSHTLQPQHQCPLLLQHPALQYPQPPPNKSGSSIFPIPPYFSTRIPSGKRTKFCHCSKALHKEAYIAAVEEACSRLSPREADELISDTNHLLRNHCTHTKPNLTM